MQNQKSLVIGFVVIVLFIIAGFFISQSINTPPEEDEEVLTGSNQNPPAQTLTQAQRESIVSTYIQAKISELSPELPVLGGTFYVTDISFTGPSQGEVSYEDGHIALIADFDYTINEAILSQGEAAVQVTVINVRDQ